MASRIVRFGENSLPVTLCFRQTDRAVEVGIREAILAMLRAAE
jgi:hypothetical protein